jgi:hypothetical protein
MERIDRILTAVDAQLQEAINREDVRLTAIETRLAALEQQYGDMRIGFDLTCDAMRGGQRSGYTDRDLAKAMALLNRDG